jgi:hypothetical protein
MRSDGMIKLEESSNEPSHRFDRTRFKNNMDSFDNMFGSQSAASLPSLGANDDEILSLDDSVASSSTDKKKDASSISHGGALEQTLKLSPVKRSKNKAKEFKEPKSAPGRKGLGLARFLKVENPDPAAGGTNGESKSSMPGLEPIWQYSDIMSVGAPSVAGDAEDNQTPVATRKSAHTYHPSSGNSVATSDQLWDRATKTIAARKTGVPRRSLSVGPTALPQQPEAVEEEDSKPLKRSQSLVQPSPSKTPRRKLKKKIKDGMSKSDHNDAIKSPAAFVSPSRRDTKSRIRVPSKAAQDFANTNLTGIAVGSTAATREETVDTSPKSPKDRKKHKIKDKKHKKEKSKSIAGEIVAKLDAKVSRPSRKDKDDKDPIKKKKTRSKSLSRANLYEHEPSDSTKRDPGKRRASKRELRASFPGDAVSVSGRSVSASPKPNRHSCSASLAGGQKRLSRRQLLKKMDSESVISAPAGISSMNRGDVRSRSPRPGRSSTTLPRRGDSRRNLSGSLYQPDLDHRDDAEGNDITSPLTRRANSRRNLMSGSNHGPPSAKGARRKLSTDPEDQRKLVKRIESVNSFFGKGLGEIGSAYPSTSKRNLMIDDDGDEETKKPESFRRKGKKSDKKSSRHLSGLDRKLVDNMS